jgi:hypothetical protein
MPLLRQYQLDIVTKTFEADARVRHTIPTTFDESRVLELSLPLDYLADHYDYDDVHYGTRNENQWTSVTLLRALSSHMHAVRIAIRLDNASKHIGFPTGGMLIGMMCTTMWESLESSRWFWREPMGSRIQLEFPNVHVRDVEVTWENKEWSHKKRHEFGKSVECTYMYLASHLNKPFRDVSKGSNVVSGLGWDRAGLSEYCGARWIESKRSWWEYLYTMVYWMMGRK